MMRMWSLLAFAGIVGWSTVAVYADDAPPAEEGQEENHREAFDLLEEYFESAEGVQVFEFEFDFEFGNVVGKIMILDDIEGIEDLEDLLPLGPGGFDIEGIEDLLPLGPGGFGIEGIDPEDLDGLLPTEPGGY